MPRTSIVFLSAVLLVLASATQAATPAATWVAGKHYVVLSQPQPTHVAPGKVEVLEVFSYACPACNHFQPVMQQLKAALLPNAEMAYLPASWHPEEDWPVFQRAYFAAQSLGIAAKNHDAMFNAIWTTGELAIADPKTGRIKSKMPDINDIAHFYQRVAGVKAADFLTAAKSFGVGVKMHEADAQIAAMQTPSTPTLVVNGKYRVNSDSVSSVEEFIALVNFLVARDSVPASLRK